MADIGPITVHLEVGVAPKRHALIVASLQPALPNSIALYVAAGVPNHRLVEILEGWRFLSNGIRDRALFPFSKFPGLLYSSAPIHSMTENARLTASDPVIISTPGHVGIGIHDDLRTDPAALGSGASDHTNIIEGTFKSAIEYAREHERFIAAGNYWNAAQPGIALDAVTAGFVVDTPGTYSVTPVRTPGPVMEAQEVTGSFATVRDLYDEFMRNTPTSWNPYYRVHQDGDGVPWLEPWAVPLEHTSITETWV